MSTKHSKAAAKFLKDKKQAAWHDETLWIVREKRDRLSKEIPEWEELRDMACATKLYSNSHLEELLLEFEKNALANGAQVHWAKDAEEYRSIIYDILSSHGVKHYIKSKSMLAEECELNPFLEEKGIEVVESDLGERILQLMDEKPSHIVMPAIHLKREQVGELFEKEMGTEKGNSDPTYLTHAARKNLRQKFIHAEAAMTGGNFAVASTGEVVVCTNEGNADMGTSQPKLQIAAFGMEKIVPDRRSLAVFTRLLARSATGQPVTTYTSHYRKPREGGEFHIIIVDNGRSKILADSNHVKALNCIRCGACMNTCPVYRRTGGYSYTYFIPGPIGINLGMLKDASLYSDNVSACSLCYSCSNVCPAKVDLAEQIYLWRQDLNKLGKADAMKKMMSGGMKFMMERPSLFNFGMAVAPFGMGMLKALGLTWGAGRDYPDFAKDNFNKQEKKNRRKSK
jgi:L-lactate dehydrogenase complex protein LldF